MKTKLLVALSASLILGACAQRNAPPSWGVKDLKYYKLDARTTAYDRTIRESYSQTIHGLELLQTAIHEKYPSHDYRGLSEPNLIEQMDWTKIAAAPAAGTLLSPFGSQMGIFPYSADGGCTQKFYQISINDVPAEAIDLFLRSDFGKSLRGFYVDGKPMPLPHLPKKSDKMPVLSQCQAKDGMKTHRVDWIFD